MVNTVNIMGVDFGQSADPSAAVLLQRTVYEPGFVGPRDARIKLRFARRWPLGTDYCEIVRMLVQAPANVFIVDFTGVGRPIVDMLRKEMRANDSKGRLLPVNITGSNAVSREKTEANGSHWSVPKCDLIASINILREQKLLVLPRSEETAILLNEMAQFRMKYTKVGNQQFEARSGAHDDLVIAFGLACWYISRFGHRTFNAFC